MTKLTILQGPHTCSLYHKHELILPTICLKVRGPHWHAILDASKEVPEKIFHSNPFCRRMQEHAPFDRKEHLKRAMQKKQEKASKKRGAVAYATQLKQKDITRSDTSRIHSISAGSRRRR